jgi:RHS repeat-associated protein
MRQTAVAVLLLVTAFSAVADGPTFIGSPASSIKADLATTYPFTDDPLLSKSTHIKRAHLVELRAAVDAVRQQAGLSPVAWTEPQPTHIRAIHVTELRAALQQAFTALRRPLPEWSEPVVVGGGIKATHYQEIRNAARWEATGTITSNATWTPSGSPYVVRGIVTVANGATLTIGSGTVVKFEAGASLIVRAGATLVANGTPSNLVVFTSIKDDTAGGDTNRDGNNSTPQPGDWNALEIGNDGRAYGSITNAVVRFGGRLGIINSTLALSNVTSTKMSGEGLHLKTPPGPYTASNLRLLDNQTNLQLIDVSSQTTIRDSAIRGATYAAVIARSGTAARLINNSIDDNRGLYAILVDGLSPLYLRENSITRNRTTDGLARGISTSCCQTVDARNNWWGSTTGPEIAGQSNSGGGGQVGDYVTYEPWLGQNWADGFRMGDHPWTMKAGVSVDVTSGNFYLEESDLAIATVGFPLEIVRTYNNKIAGGTSTDFGVGWTWNYGTQLETNVDANGVIWYRDDGTRAYFKRNFDGTFSGEDGIYEKLVKEAGLYRLTNKDQSMLIFDLNGRLGAQQDENQNTTVIIRNTAGRVTRVDDPTGRRITFEYSSSRISRITDPLGRTIEYEYASNGAIRTVRKRDQQGAVYATSTYTYGSGGAWELIAVADGDGNNLEMTYDDEQRVEEQALNGSIDIDFAYGPTTKRGISIGEWETLVFDLRGLAHLYQFTKGNKVTDHHRQVMTGGGGWTWSNDEHWSYTGYLANSCREFEGTDGTTVSTYDWNTGNLTRLVEPGGAATSHTYDAFNNLTSTTDRRGFTTTYEYDGFHRLVKVTDPLGRSTRHEYGPRGLRTRTIDALNRATTFTYDQWGYPATVVNAAGETVSFTYDIAGRKLSETTPQNGQTTYTYDGRGNVLTSTDALHKMTVYGYDSHGRKTSVTDALNHTTTYRYSDFRNALSDTIDARGGQIHLSRDGNDANMVTDVRDANNHTTHFEYDDLHRRIEETDPLGNTWRFTYTGRDRLKTVTDARGRRTTYHYDDGLQLVAIQHADDRWVDYQYDAAGNKTRMTDWTGTTRWTYDALNRVVLVTRNGTETSYVYDEVGNLSSLTLEPGKPVTYTYDDANRLKTVTDWQGRKTTYTYTSGRMAGYTLPNGVTTIFGYDNVGRPTSIRYERGANIIASFDYGYDAVGNRVWRRNTDGRQESYAYDELYRLIWVSYPGHPGFSQEEYAYDATGNRIRKSVYHGGPWQHSYFSYDAADRLLNDGNGSCAYDANGSLLGCGSQSFSWDAQGHLSYAYTGGLETNYVYDGDGRRTGWYRGSTSREYLVNTVAAPHEALKETDQNGNGTYFVYGHDLLYVIDSRGPRYHHTDALGSVMVTTDANGRNEASNDFHVFGDYRGYGYTYERTRRRFTGEEDDDNGLIYLRARFYHPASGRFLSRDPFPMNEADSQSINRYVYVQNNPVNLTDPTGEIPVLLATGLAGMGMGLLSQGLSDLMAGDLSGWKSYAGAGAGGFIAGVSPLGKVRMLGKAAKPLGAALGSATESVVNQGGDFSTSQFTSDVLMGTALDRVKPLKIKGRPGSIQTVQKSMMTKSSRGSIKRVRGRTAGKLIFGQTIVNAPTWTMDSVLRLWR